MNIFALSYNPELAARFHCDKHVVKMTVELYQQLGSAVRRHGATDSQMPITKSGTPLRGGYKHHPCTIWCGDCRIQFDWAYEHAIALCQEYTYRYDKTHFCEAGIKKLGKLRKRVPVGEYKQQPQAMPDEFKKRCSIDAYRTYYRLGKQKTITMTYTKRPAPYWL